MPLDATTAALTGEIAAARTALTEHARTRPGEWWDPYELKAEARNGWTSGAMTLALNDLIDDGTFEVGDQLRVRPRD